MTFEETRRYLSESGTPEDLAVLDWLNELKERVEMDEKWTFRAFPKPKKESDS